MLSMNLVHHKIKCYIISVPPNTKEIPSPKQPVRAGCFTLYLKKYKGKPSLFPKKTDIMCETQNN